MSAGLFTARGMVWLAYICHSGRSCTCSYQPQTESMLISRKPYKSETGLEEVLCIKYWGTCISKGVVTRVFDPRRKHKLWRLILLRNGVYVVYLSEKKRVIPCWWERNYSLVVVCVDRVCFSLFDVFYFENEHWTFKWKDLPFQVVLSEIISEFCFLSLSKEDIYIFFRPRFYLVADYFSIL